MQTQLADFIRDTPEGHTADAILRSCVHCGFCNATCPTYQLTGDELDGPRGRLYLMKQMFEGQPVGAETRLHLDRCLTCRSCESTCPSGVRYAQLLDLGRQQIDRQAPRPWPQRLQRWALRRFLLSPRLFGLALRIGRWLGRQAPALPAAAWPAQTHLRRILLLEGCVQPALDPATDAALARVLDRLGIGVLSVGQIGCCGALSQHLGAEQEARAYMRRNLDAWRPHLDQVEAVLATASGCGVQLKDYGRLLADDPVYAASAARLSALVKDPVELLESCDLSLLQITPRRIAFHAPCTLQHGQRLKGRVEALLTLLGFELTPVADSHLCCGAAGTYSILQPAMSSELKRRKLTHLAAGQPELIATANIGCQMHLAASADRPVVHWLTLLDNPPE